MWVKLPFESDETKFLSQLLGDSSVVAAIQLLHHVSPKLQKSRRSRKRRTPAQVSRIRCCRWNTCQFASTASSCKHAWTRFRDGLLRGCSGLLVIPNAMKMILHWTLRVIQVSIILLRHFSTLASFRRQGRRQFVYGHFRIYVLRLSAHLSDSVNGHQVAYISHGFYLQGQDWRVDILVHLYDFIGLD